MQGTMVSILLVEDDEVDVEAVRRGFMKQRIANPLVVAADGMQALDILRGTADRPPLAPPFVILLDLNMPRMSGIEFLKELRADPKLGHSVVFVLTTSKADEDKLAAYRHHIAGYVIKEEVGAAFIDLVKMLGFYCQVVDLPR